ncbi:MAG: hypothetical protein MUC49_14310 [Raineya sp.]|jgi:hypothetical protein|nr:hypothetical protein [Raineya sp.]
MKFWFTRPENPFDSFYVYDQSSKVFVRVRLELDRYDSGRTKCIYKTNRYVGFSQTDYTEQEVANFKLNVDGRIYDAENNLLDTEPQQGYYVYDFSSTDGINPDETPHRGNKVISNPQLPPNVTTNILIWLVIKTLILRNDIILTSANSSPERLSNVIFRTVIN